MTQDTSPHPAASTDLSSLAFGAEPITVDPRAVARLVDQLADATSALGQSRELDASPASTGSPTGAGELVTAALADAGARWRVHLNDLRDATVATTTVLREVADGYARAQLLAEEEIGGGWA
jgi:hypothetical protein